MPVLETKVSFSQTATLRKRVQINIVKKGEILPFNDRNLKKCQLASIQILC